MILCDFPGATMTNYHRLNSFKPIFTPRVVESRGLKPKWRPGCDEGSGENPFFSLSFWLELAMFNILWLFTCVIMMSAFVTHLSLL